MAPLILAGISLGANALTAGAMVWSTCKQTAANENSIKHQTAVTVEQLETQLMQTVMNYEMMSAKVLANSGRSPLHDSLSSFAA